MSISQDPEKRARQLANLIPFENGYDPRRCAGGVREGPSLLNELQKLMSEECGSDLQEIIDKVVSKKGKKANVAKAMAAAWVMLFMKGNGPAITEALGRIDGALPKVLTGAGGKDLFPASADPIELGNRIDELIAKRGNGTPPASNGGGEGEG